MVLLSVLSSCGSDGHATVESLAKALRIRRGVTTQIARETLPETLDLKALRLAFAERFDAGWFVSSSQLAVQYRTLVGADFSAGKLINASGWLLAETERDLFALVHDR